jgi:hypothetical protein
MLGGSAYLWCVARPVEAFAAIPLATRRFEDLGRYQFAAMVERVRAAEQHAAELLGGRTVCRRQRSSSPSNAKEKLADAA